MVLIFYSNEKGFKMKILMLFLLLSCSHKYQTYHIIDKNNFDKNNPSPPITEKKFPGKKIEFSQCAGQFFWSSNAVKDTERLMSMRLRSFCGKSKTILNSKITETWWTTIAYSRACLEFVGYCPR